MKTSPQIYPEDYSCIIEPQQGKGGIYIGNLEAAQNINTLHSYYFSTQNIRSKLY